MFQGLLIALLAAEARAGGDPQQVYAFVRAHSSGGLIIQCGAADSEPAERLAASGRYLVQILDGNAARVSTARAALQERGLYGLVTVDRLDRLDGPQHLPYAENLANIVYWADRQPKLPLAEIARILCPGGWMIADKTGATARDLQQAGLAEAAPIAPDSSWLAARKPWPAEMDQWPQPRHGADGNTVSRDTLVGPPRRVRWIAGPPQEISNMVSAAGRNFYGGVLARDAFNGLPLWQQKLTPPPERGGFSYKPGSQAPRPVAAGADLLAFFQGKLAALDGATGELKREYPEAGTPSEVVVDGSLILAIDAGSIRAIDHQSGKRRWTFPSRSPRYVVAGDGGIYFLRGEPRRGDKVSLVKLDKETGKSLWEQKGLDWLPAVRQCVYHAGRIVCEVSTLADEKKGNMIQVLSAADGRPLWNHVYVPGTAHMKQARAMFVGELLWLLAEEGCVALDPANGQQKRAFKAGWGHCYPPAATARFLLHGEMHLTDLATGQLDATPITKGNCSRDIGFMPANGLIYTTPKHCVCWPMLRDYTALAPAKPSAGSGPPPSHVDFELEQGEVAAPPDAPPDVPQSDAGQWPCYRGDGWRSASTAAKIPTDLKTAWTARLGGWPQGTIPEDWRTNSYVRGPITPPVVAGGLVYVARPDAHEIVALDASSGGVRWRQTLSGRVDTPPTISSGLCLFGTKTGYVYALRADDGGMVWRLRAAPEEERIVAYGQVESPWPVAGSVLVVDGVLYFAAGRQPLADGGIRVFAVRPTTGEVLWVERLDQVPQQFDDVKHPFYNSTGLEFDNFDLLHREGERVAMSRWLFDPRTGKMTCDRYNGFTRVDMEGSGGGVWMPRGCWSYAPRNESEYRKERPFLRPLAAARGNRLYSMSEDRATVFRRDFNLAGGEQFDTSWFAGWKTYGDARKGGDLWRSQRLAHGAKWTITPFPGGKEAAPASAMLLAANALVVAGGRGGVALLSPEDGSLIGRAEVPAPLWDGLAAAGGRLFVATQDGSVVCLAGEK